MQDELVRQAQRGDAEAFDSLARMVGDRCLAIAVRILRDIDLAEDAVYAIADRFLAVSHRILGDIDLAEDATQQALLNVWQTLPSCVIRPASRPGRTGSSCAPATPRAGSAAVGRRT